MTDAVDKLVVLKIAASESGQGFSVVLQLSLDGQPPYLEQQGSLPPAAHLSQLYGHWQDLYQRLGHPLRLDAPAQQQTNVSWPDDFRRVTQHLAQAFNDWLQSLPFQEIREKLLEQLSPSDSIRILIQTPDRQLEKMPWHRWQLLERYPRAEVALSAPAYERREDSRSPSGQVHLLAVLGHSMGINTHADRAILAALPGAQVRFLVEPSCQDLTDALWSQPWDILFFAGHSTSQSWGARAAHAETEGSHSSGTGKAAPTATAAPNQIALNANETLTIAQFRYALKKAVERGLQLAILNSCDGLGLAHDLSDLHIPQLIVMREPVPDQVAQAFLQYFMDGFAQGHPLYLAVREARERLQGLEDRFPGATGLPIIFQNPAVLPATWERLRGHVSVDSTPPSSRLTGVGLGQMGLRVLSASLLMTALVIGVRWLGWLQPLELWALDQMMRHRPLELPDARLLVVTITEADIQAQQQRNRQGTSLPDVALVELLEQLEARQPRVIGLDIYRDFPVQPEYPQLAQQLQQNDRILALCKGRDAEVDPIGVRPPPEVPETRLGFSDFLEDPDGILRRQILAMEPDPVSPCPTPFAFGTLAALRYLHEVGVSVQFDPHQIRLGAVTAPYLRSRTGGYQRIDARGSQLLLNYRALDTPQEIAPQVTLDAILSGQVNPDLIRDRLVLVGVTANTLGDYWSTPYGASARHKVPGVLIQAHMASQLLSAALDQRPLLRVWPQWGEVLWIGSWAIVGGMVGVLWGTSRRTVWVSSVSVLVLTGLSFGAMTQSLWLPWVPTVLGFCLTPFFSLRSRSAADIPSGESGSGHPHKQPL